MKQKHGGGMQQRLTIQCSFCKKKFETNKLNETIQSHFNQFNAPCVGNHRQGEIIDNIIIAGKD